MRRKHGPQRAFQKPAEAEQIDLRTFEKRSHTPFPTHFQVLTVTGNSPEFSAFLPEVTGFSSKNKGIAINHTWMRRKHGPQRACPKARGSRAHRPHNLRSAPYRPGTHTKISNSNSPLAPKLSLGAAPYPQKRPRKDNQGRTSRTEGPLP